MMILDSGLLFWATLYIAAARTVCRSVRFIDRIVKHEERPLAYAGHWLFIRVAGKTVLLRLWLVNSPTLCNISRRSQFVKPICVADRLNTFLQCFLLRTHVQKTVSRCFAVLCQLRQIRCSVPQLYVAVAGGHSGKFASRFSTFVAPTISLTHSSAFIGCVFLNASGLKLPLLCTVVPWPVHLRC